MDKLKRVYTFLIPSIADIFFITIFSYLSFSAGKGLLNDGDTGYHIRAGEFIIDTFSFPKYDMFSFISPPLSWTAHEWLSEIIMALIHRIFGLTGIVIFFAFAIALVYYMLFKIIRIYRYNIIIAALLVSLVIASSQIHWLARPHIFSLFFLIIWYYLLDNYQYNNKNYLYLLPPIMLIWVNLHGGFMSGFILLCIYISGNLLKFVFSKGTDREKCKIRTRLLSLTMICCLLISLINPFGYNILLFPFKLASNKFIMDNVSEFISPNFHEPMKFTYLLFLMISIFAISRKALNIIEILLIVLFTYMALYSARYIPLFAIIVAPILLKQIETILESLDVKFIESFRKRANRISNTDASTKGYLWPICAILVVVIFALTVSMEYKFDKNIKPVDAVQFLKREYIQGNMFNNDEFGDYIIYSAWPKYRVFIDGRLDMYGDSRIKEYFKIIRIQPGWEEVLKKYKIDWIIYNANSSLSLFLIERDEWKLIYADEVANIFVRKIPENQYLIDKYRDIKLVIKKDKYGSK